MSWSKSVTVGFHKVEISEENYFDKFVTNADSILSSKNATGNFDVSGWRYLWQIYSKIDLGKNSFGYLLAIVKECKGYPMLFTEEGELNEITSSNGERLGDIAYGLFCPERQLLLCLSSAANFKRMLGQFAVEGGVRMSPLCENDIDEKVLNWDSFKKVSIKMNIPTREEVAQFQRSKTGKLSTILGALDGVKLHIMVGAETKDSLSNIVTKDMLQDLLENEYCTSLAVHGSEFENGTAEQVDLKKAHIKYKETIEVEGNYITPTDVTSIFLRAFAFASQGKYI